MDLPELPTPCKHGVCPQEDCEKCTMVAFEKPIGKCKGPHGSHRYAPDPSNRGTWKPSDGRTCMDCGEPDPAYPSPQKEAAFEKPVETRFVFVDIETTGLNPLYDRPLEVAAIITDTHLNEIDSFHSFCYTPLPGQNYPPPMGEEIRLMHEASGLWKDLLAFHASEDRWKGYPHETDYRLRAWLSGKHQFKVGEVRIAGYSCHFDRQWLQARFPETFFMLHYRMFDVSTVRELVVKWNNPQWKEVIKKACGESKHRAMDDCYAAIRELQNYKKLFHEDSYRMDTFF